MKRAMDETGDAKLFSMNITADDHYECWRVRFRVGSVWSRCKQAGIPGGRFCGRPGMVTTAVANIHNNTCTTIAQGTAWIYFAIAVRGLHRIVLAKMSRLQGASGIHVGTMGFRQDGRRC